ncbi:NifU family protein [Aequorivita xiaoshiensis]|uniref:NifU family protein n=1 Tax=Aequorivita xiaoshiensis TaxID=2874476 RepID=A0A9X1R353_9FLAO|nr:NifU family protein [Aequorivita xiaoshiensis]MCG2430703.1 NifU family protein [Aequorivita xiaoshiensis]
MEIVKTSNPSIVKFVSDSFLTKASSFEFKNIDEAKNSALAQQLFYLPFVKTVYISQNFVAIEKYNIVEWEDVQEEVAESISEYIKSGRPAVTEVEVVAPKKLPVSIYAESTPNPTVMKFVANKTLAEGTFEFKSVEDAILSPLAQALFNFPFVKEVFISNNYVSVTKHNMIDWEEISMEIREFLRQYVQDDKLIVKDEISKASNISNNIGSADSSLEKNDKNYSDVEKEIISILNEYVKPAVARDGGNIMFDSFNQKSKTVKVVLQGACSGCPSSTITLKNGIETMLKELMKGQVESVVAING